MEKNVLESKLAGTWYPADPQELGAELNEYIESVSQEPLGDVMALLLPHAGYRYSGEVAAHGIAQLKGRSIKRVVVLGPSHRVHMPGMVSIPDVSHIRTPLGTLELDLSFIDALRRHKAVHSVPSAHMDEHSVQIQLPLLQQVLGDFKLVPIVTGQLNEQEAAEIGGVLRRYVDADTLVVSSSDFTHYGRNFAYVPFEDNIQENLCALDMGAFEKVEQKDLSGFQQYIDSTCATICGRCPISVLLAMLPDDAAVHLLRYDTSGNMTGDWTHCVSYLSAAFTGCWGNGAALDCGEELLSAVDKLELLRLARSSIEHYMEHGKKAKSSGLGCEIRPAMKTVMGAFVTLHQNGQLRGCIGEIFPRRELCGAVVDRAVDSAVNDPRFPPVSPDEVEGLHIEISALCPPRPVDSWKDIVVGKHGMTLSKDGHFAVFLPQVAPEQGWGIEETLTHLSMKAGLGPDDWREGCDYEVFEAIVFSEG